MLWIQVFKYLSSSPYTLHLLFLILFIISNFQNFLQFFSPVIYPFGPDRVLLPLLFANRPFESLSLNQGYSLQCQLVGSLGSLWFCPPWPFLDQGYVFLSHPQPFNRPFTRGCSPSSAWLPRLDLHSLISLSHHGRNYLFSTETTATTTCGFDNIGKVIIPQKVHTCTDISKTAHKITLVDLRTLLKPVAWLTFIKQQPFFSSKA